MFKGIRKRYFIFGSDHDEAYKYIISQISGVDDLTETKEDENKQMYL